MRELKAAAAHYLVKPLEYSAQLELSSETKTRILKGEILHVGKEQDTKFGGHLTPEFKTGDIVYFLSYEGNYDNLWRDNENYYAVLFEDVVAYE